MPSSKREKYVRGSGTLLQAAQHGFDYKITLNLSLFFNYFSTWRHNKNEACNEVVVCNVFTREGVDLSEFLASFQALTPRVNTQYFRDYIWLYGCNFRTRSKVHRKVYFATLLRCRIVIVLRPVGFENRRKPNSSAENVGWIAIARLC